MCSYTMTALINACQNEPPGTSGGGGLYTRWGNSTCPSVSGTKMVYAGKVGGAYFNHNGSGANYLCMPSDPQYTLPVGSGEETFGYIYGAKYDSPIKGPDDHNVPCAVCLATSRETVLMIPARSTCPSSWTTEYIGYLMSEKWSHHRSMFECVDKSLETTESSQTLDGALFYHAEVDCDRGLDCPPYDGEKELTCVVCTM